MSATYLRGLDAIVGVDTGKAVLVRVRNAADLAKAKLSILEYAGDYAPDALDALVYDEVASQMRDALAAGGARADVRVVDLPVKSLEPPPPSGGTARDLVVGAIGSVIGGFVLLFLTRRKKS